MRYRVVDVVVEVEVVVWVVVVVVDVELAMASILRGSVFGGYVPRQPVLEPSQPERQCSLTVNESSHCGTTLVCSCHPPPTRPW